ncbi:MAG: DUF502 domain-containing protein [Candidatus Endonucleobacter bathymodioli]|uniref:DUF502 domain-containing protein n=1 Tax=Candidatus Endonucleibacter bathymodioli TaxID=539814 RepID=A0AA90NN14_9GAMM|nr:DUF502 domain-containing protein [Candidatus Endonucleobacter bathymodioli]
MNNDQKIKTRIVSLFLRPRRLMKYSLKEVKLGLGKRFKFRLVRIFLNESVIGGLAIVLPLVVIVFFANWLVKGVSHWISPLADLFNRYNLPVVLSDVIVVILFVIICSIIGRVVKTKLGGWIYQKIETALLKYIPGYQLLKDMVEMIASQEAGVLKGDVAKVWLYGRSVPTWTIALITSKQEDGTYTAFVPTSPSPASGVVYQLPSEQVEIHPDITIENFLKVVVSCGAGSSKLFEKIVHKEELSKLYEKNITLPAD